MDRRKFFRLLGAGGVLGLLKARAQTPPWDEETFAPMKTLGAPLSEYGQRSPFEEGVVRYISPNLRTRHSGADFAPLEKLEGVITPNGLHFERHHGGVPQVDPAKYRLVIHGMVERPLVFTLEDLKRFPSVTRTYFIECAGNGQNGYRNPPDPNLTATRSRGLASNASWTGVPLALLLKEAGVKPGAKWLIPEGMDAAAYTRSLPLEKAMEDVLVAYAQNGEALRPEQGYPVRLVVPGWEGSIQVKWLRRILVTDLPAMAKDETSEYTDVMADGKVLAFTWVMDPESIITYPSGLQQIKPGFHEIRGLAWSGYGRITKVEISFDEGKTWRQATLEPPVERYAFVRFKMPWHWDGKEVVLWSRAWDEKGNTQPTREEFFKKWGRNNRYHYNAIQAWRILPDGRVVNGDRPLGQQAFGPVGGCDGEVFDG
ncbi:MULTISPECIES: sulfite dehydrogenase [Thermus]|jgi:sulfane dehydrogenase subunit SoxC|uniref:Sulfite dehydrogenase n=2 Tax=Thermus scotoductus TaxID=37636 RepID=A0A0N0IQB3_THESC|nr:MULTISPECIES: sulfite dehydrogenase [Thermus]ADW22705.1 sulfite dehydrogenase [Thermus scotoductus SA-01]ETN88127.1 molybdopterin binding oxidoreductase [Thermus sp. NMX2.A1]KPD29127.1 sulfite dehydrogenase [Thermus scotoductus]HAR68750.1 sulfite dehydrogenase [Thermus scotoductus]